MPSSLESEVYDMKKALEKALKVENMKVYIYYKFLYLINI